MTICMILSPPGATWRGRSLWFTCQHPIGIIRTSSATYAHSISINLSWEIRPSQLLCLLSGRSCNPACPNYRRCHRIRAARRFDQGRRRNSLSLSLHFCLLLQLTPPYRMRRWCNVLECDRNLGFGFSSDSWSNNSIDWYRRRPTTVTIYIN